MQIYIQNIRQGFSQFTEREGLTFLREPYRSVYNGPAHITVDMERKRRQIRANITLKMTVQRVCDDCLTEFSESIELQSERIIVIGANELSEDVEVITLPADAHQLDLAPVLGEMIVLNHPMKILCKPDCKGLCPGCAADLNISECSCRNESIDPRWEELKKLLK